MSDFRGALLGSLAIHLVVVLLLADGLSALAGRDAAGTEVLLVVATLNPAPPNDAPEHPTHPRRDGASAAVGSNRPEHGNHVKLPGSTAGAGLALAGRPGPGGQGADAGSDAAPGEAGPSPDDLLRYRLALARLVRASGEYPDRLPAAAAGAYAEFLIDSRLPGEPRVVLQRSSGVATVDEKMLAALSRAAAQVQPPMAHPGLSVALLFAPGGGE